MSVDARVVAEKVDTLSAITRMQLSRSVTWMFFIAVTTGVNSQSRRPVSFLTASAGKGI